MNRLDKIKNDFHCAKVGEVHGDTDIQYLLSIIEQAEKAFIRIRDIAIDNIEDLEYVDITDEILKSIQGE